MRLRNLQKKTGVSLVTVLLFMLVATIAATATYKWLTSEGRSSGARLQKQTAYQSSLAGIENARSWMTYHANDVGALIKTYLDSAQKPINIDSRLRSLQRPGQNYHVWLTGVNTKDPTYKLKILSVGEAGGGARHSEIAIFNVDGLYRVSVPVEHHHATTDFEYAYFGGGVSGTNTSYESAVINGNWGANPPNTNKNWIVTGNASLSGSMISVGKTSCIGGNLNANNGITSKDLFVGGDITGTALRVNIEQDAFIGGNMVVGDQPVEIGRHLTMLGKIKTKPSAVQFSVGGNLCAGENATLVHDKGAPDRQTVVKGNVWMPGPYNIWHKDITCTAGTKKNCRCDVNGTEHSCDEFGVRYSQQYKVKSCTETPQVCDFNQQNSESGARCHCSQFKLSASLPADNYDFGADFPADNYKNYEYLWDATKKNRGFLLGEGTDTKVYVKSGRSWSHLDGKATDKFTEKTDHPRQCLKGYSAWRGMESHICGNKPYVASDTDPHYKPWSNEKYSPYYSYDSAKSNKPSSLYYIYYMPDGVTDVNFGTYDDSYWKWCESVFGDYCTRWASSTQMYGYFVNAQANEKSYVFTNSGHSNDDGNHPVKVGDLYYRFLNMDNAGGEITGSPWCKKAKNKEWRPVCGVGPYFASNGDVEHNMPTDVSPSEWPAEGQPFECAESVKATCDAIWVQAPGCDAAAYKVPDALVTARNSFEPYASKGCAAEITEWKADLVDKLNSCYEDHKNDENYVNENFYNGYVVVKLTSASGNGFTGTLNGKFIIIVDEQINAQNGIITASDGSYVLLYLTKGASYLQGIAKNLFIYSTGPFTETSKMQLTGTIYTPADSCIRVRFENAELKYSQELVSALTAANVICNNDGSACGGAVTSSASTVTSSTSESTSGGYDKYYISMAPQLGVTLESQYENNETLPTAENQAELKPSFIILPRVIYLPSDPYGYLNDYYSVRPLNGSTITKDDLTNVSCSPTLNIATKLYDGTTELTQGLYRCVAKANAHPDVPFWVKVSDATRGAPSVSFVEASQEMPVSGTKEIHVTIDPHAEPITIATTCPAAPSGWTYTPNSGSVSDNVCTFDIPANPETEVRKLFDVSTSDASNGTVTFYLKEGVGYNRGVAYAELHVSSTATLNREEATSTEVMAYCHENPGVCPADVSNWPKMDCENSSVEWVKPTGDYGYVTKNYSWTVSVGGSGSVTLQPVTVNGCVAVIPTTDNSYELAALEKDHEYTLRASVFAQKKTLRVGFVGDPGDNKDPVIVVTVGTRGTKECPYSSISGEPRYCSVDVFAGESVTLMVKDDDESENFSYWKCASDNCPDKDPLPNKNYGTFTVSGNYDYLAHFGEYDKHCFFDEFKDSVGTTRANRADIECLGGSTGYCIDYCDGTCPTATTERNIKWRLLRGSISDIAYSQSYGHISAKSSVNKGKKDSNRDGIVVMSTVNAGIKGTMKALVQLPRASSHGFESKAIRNSGFILHSESTASQYLMLNLYANSSGNLEAQVCKYMDGEYSNCHHKELLDGSSTVPVDVASMVMVSIELNGNFLNVSAFTGNYYGSSPTQYSIQFDISSFDYNDYAHEYVGFSLADQNFKIHGIGWMSVDYKSECHDTYPVVKCSFAAVAKGGIIETDTNITPWVGHSGWFDRATWSCTEQFYYYNGSDAGCGSAGNNGLECNPYHFDKNGAGAHGYYSEGKDMKTAKAWLDCRSTPESSFWTVASEAERAHCGYFWTGEYSECANNASLLESEVTISGGYKQSIPFPNSSLSTVNLRKAKLTITLENNDNNEVEIWLYSKNEDGWGADGDFESQSVRMRTASETFDVAAAFVGDSSGFNPEKVLGIVVANHGNTYITVKSITSVCDNAISISGCNAAYDEDSQQWIVTANVSNRKNIETVTYSATVDGVAQFTQGCSSTDCIGEDDVVNNTTVFSLPPQEDYPFEHNQGKSYVFKVSITGNNNRSSDTFTCSVSPTVIGSVSASCWLDGVEDGTPPTKQQGRGLPTFKASFSGCPAGGCGYKVTLVETGNVFATSSGSSMIEHTPSGNTETAAPYAFTAGEVYTYRLESTDDKFPFATCDTTFKIVEKKADPVKLSCSITSQSGASLSSTQAIPASEVTATNCESGCKYTITEGSTIIEGPTDYAEDSPITFFGATESGKHPYTLSVERTKDGSKASCPVFTITYPLDVTCGTLDVGSESSPWDPDDAVPISPTTVNGCGGNCSWSITGGVSPTDNSGSGYTSGDISFRDANAHGPQPYTLTIAHAGVSNATCNFNVTYEELSSSSEESSSSVASSSSTGGCHCTDYCDEGCNNIELASGDYNSSAENRCVFFASATKLNLGDHSSKYLYLNGKKFDYNVNEVCNSASTCESWLASNVPSTADGGYYMYLPGSYNYASVTISGYDPCATVTSPTITACPVASATVSTGRKVKITPTTTNCNVMGGCDYTILPDGTGDKTGKYYSGNITFTGESTPGTVNYTIAISNSAGAAPSTCAFSVEYKVPEVTTIALGQTKSIKCGDSFKSNITCTDNCAKVKCAGSFSKTVTGSVSGPKTEGQYNDVQFINGWANTATINETFSTECDDDKTLSCSASCGC